MEWRRIILFCAYLSVSTTIVVLIVARSWSYQRDLTIDSSVRSRLKQIGLQLQNYFDSHGAWPPLVSDTTGGFRHSWRTILSMEGAQTPDVPNLNAAWDAVLNRRASLGSLAGGWSDWRDDLPGVTRYFAVIPASSTLSSGKDDILYFPWPVVAIPDSRIEWMEPRDLTQNEFDKIVKLHATGGRPVHFITRSNKIGTFNNGMVIFDISDPPVSPSLAKSGITRDGRVLFQQNLMSGSLWLEQ